MKTLSVFLILISIFVGVAVQAASNQNLVYHGRIAKPDGTPINAGNVEFTIQVLSPAASNCILWEEKQTVPMSNSMGAFNLELGNLTNRTSGLPSFNSLFMNAGTLTGLSCSGGATTYSPAATDERLLKVSFNDAGTIVDLAAMPIKSVPYALQASQIGGYGISNLVRLSGTSSTNLDPLQLEQVAKFPTVVCATNEILKWNGAAWACSADATGGSPSDAAYSAKGIVQFDTDLATSGISLTAGVAKLPAVGTAGTYGSGNQIPVFTTDAKGRVSAVTNTALALVAADIPSLDAAKITMGTVPLARGGTGATAIAANKFVVSNGTGTALQAFGCTSGQVIDFDVTAIMQCRTIGGDVSGTMAALSVDKIKGVAVTTTSLAAQDILQYNGTAWTNRAIPTCSGSQALSFNGTTYSCITAGAAPGDATYAAKGVVQFNTDAATSGISISSGVATVNAGVAANNIVKLDASAKLPAVDGSALTNLATNSSLGANYFKQSGNGFGATAVLGTTDNQNLQMNTNGAARVTVLKTGEVGIGTTGPTINLDVNAGSVSGGGMRVTGTDSPSINLSNGPSVLTMGMATYATGYSQTSATNDAVLRTSGSGKLILANQSGNSIFFSTGTSGSNDTTKMAISSGGNVGIGISAPTSKLHIQDTVTAVTGGTTSYVQTDLSPASSASFIQNGTQSFVNITGNTNLSGDVRGAYSRIVNGSSGTAGNIIGNYSAAEQAHSGGSTAYLAGTYNEAVNTNGNTGTIAGTHNYVRNAQGGTVTVAYGNYSNIRNVGTGSMGTAYGSYSHFETNDTGNIGTAYGFYSDNPARTGAGSVGTYYGLFLKDPTNATTKYGVYSEGGTNYFGGSVGLGTATPAASSAMEISSTSKGFLIPRMTAAQMGAIASPATGLQVYNLDTNQINFYNGGGWTALSTGGGSYLSSGGGTLSGPLAMGSNNITGVNAISGSTALNIYSGGTNQNLGLSSSGSGSVNIGTGNGASLSVLDVGAASANYVTVKGATAGNAPVIGTGGTDSNINLLLSPKGSGKIGIGTTSPQRKLEVEDNGNSYNGINVRNTDAGTSAKAALVANSSSSFAAFGMLGSGAGNQGFIDSPNGLYVTGNVGIGASAQADLFHVYKSGGNALHLPVRIQGGDTTSTGGTAVGMAFKTGSDSTNTLFKGGIAFEATDTAGRGKMRFMMNNVGNSSNVALTDTKMTIDAAGNVGIGTTSPLTTLHLKGSTSSAAGTTFFAENSTGGNLLQIQDDGQFFLGGGSQFSIVPFNSGAQPVANKSWLRLGGASSGSVVINPGTASDFVYLSGDKGGGTLFGNGAGAEVARVQADGKVGIGTAAPNTALDVAGALSIRGMSAPAASVSGQGRIYFDSTSNKFRVSENNGAYVDLVGSGGGTTDASALTTGTLPIARGGTNNGSLGVAAGGMIYSDGTKLMNTGSGSSGFAMVSTGSGAPAFSLLSPVGGGTGIGSYTAGSLLYASSSSALGQVGIGASGSVMTSSGVVPTWSASLGVTQGGTGRSTAFGLNSVIVSNSSGNGLLSLNCTASQVIGFDVSGNAICVARNWLNNGTDTYFSSGKVGIGTSSPNALFNIKAPNQYDGILIENGSYPIMQLEGLDANNRNGNMSLWYGDGSAKRVSIQATGTSFLSDQLGIGTQSPQGMLHAARSTSGVGLTVENRAGAGAYVDIVGSPMDVTQWTNAPPATIRFTDNNYSSSIDFRTKDPGASANGDATRMTITNNGWVGIGTSPIFKLDVGGYDEDTTSAVVNLDSTGTHFPGFAATNFMGSANTGYPIFRFWNSRGNLGNGGSAVQSGDMLGMMAGAGENQTGYSHVDGTKINFFTTENWTTSKSGAAMSFSTTPNGTTGTVERIRIDQNGYVGIGQAAPVATLDVNGFAKLKRNTAIPVTCNSTVAGSIALNSSYIPCLCNGTAWYYMDTIRTSPTACVW